MMKKDFIKLFDFYRSLSANTDRIDISSFEKAYKGKDYMERVTAGLFTYLDKDNKGFVSFGDFLQSFYPQMSRKETALICKWVVHF